jgi:hypothetical protein
MSYISKPAPLPDPEPDPHELIVIDIDNPGWEDEIVSSIDYDSVVLLTDRGPIEICPDQLHPTRPILAQVLEILRRERVRVPRRRVVS